MKKVNVVNLTVTQVKHRDYVNKQGVTVHLQEVMALNSAGYVMSFKCVAPDVEDFSQLPQGASVPFTFDVIYDLKTVTSQGKTFNISVPTFRLTGIDKTS